MKTIRKFPKLPMTIDYDEEDLEETIQERIFEKVHGYNPDAVVMLRWKGHSERKFAEKGQHWSNFFVEFDIACAFIHSASRLPVLFGYEIKWKRNTKGGLKPPAIHAGEGQMNWLLEQDASYSYLIRPRPIGPRAEQNIPALIEHLRSLSFLLIPKYIIPKWNFRRESRKIYMTIPCIRVHED